MAALDDTADIYDKCIELGLDPDSKRDCQKARDAMYAHLRNDDPNKQPVDVERVRRIAAVFKANYGAFPRDKP